MSAFTIYTHYHNTDQSCFYPMPIDDQITVEELLKREAAERPDLTASTKPADIVTILVTHTTTPREPRDVKELKRSDSPFGYKNLHFLVPETNIGWSERRVGHMVACFWDHKQGKKVESHKFR